MTIRAAVVAGIVLTFLVVACGGSGDANETPEPGDISSRPTADSFSRCFDESSLPSSFAYERDLSVDVQVEVAELYDEWGRLSVSRQLFSAEDQRLATAANAGTPLLDGRFESVSCMIEVYEDADGASKAFAGTGFNGVLLPGMSDTGTFGVVDSPEIGEERRQYYSLHPVVSVSAVLFRSGNVLARVSVQAPTSPSASAENTGLIAEAARLALVLLDQIED